MSQPQPPAAGGATVAAYDIARLAGVGRAAVSNWRRRYPDFPQPVGGSAASPLYALSEVETWLATHGKQFQLSPGDRVWQQIRGTVEDFQLGDLLGQLGAFLVLLRRDPQARRWLDSGSDDRVAAALTAAIGTTVPELPEGVSLDPAAVGVLRVAAEAIGDGDHRQVFDLVCDRYLEIHSRRWRGTAPPVAQVMVRLAGATGGSVLDPACGLGGLLQAAALGGAETVRGQELDGTAALLAAVRLLLHDTPMRLAAGDSLLADAFHGEQADAVVCNPPFHERSWGYDELTSDPRWEHGLPPRSEPELAWLQHCLSHVAPGGRVAILLPAGAAGRRAGRRIRSNLLRTGALRAVVTLPGAGPGTAGVPDLWVLRRPEPGEAPPSQVLLADATEDPDAALGAWQAFQDGVDLPDHTVAVRIIDLLDDEVDLTAARHLPRTAADDAAGFAPMGAQLRMLAGQLTAALPHLAEVGGPSLPEVSLGELIRAGVVTLHQAPLKMTTDGGTVPVVTAQDLRRQRAPSARTEAAPGLVITEPGDVVTTVASRDPVTVVLSEGGAALGPHLHLLRVDPRRLDPQFLAGCLRLGHDRTAGRSGALGSRSDVHRLTLPRLPLAAQQRYGGAFRQLADIQQQAHELTAVADTLVRHGLTGLATGTLQPNSDD